MKNYPNINRATAPSDSQGAHMHCFVCFSFWLRMLD